MKALCLIVTFLLLAIIPGSASAQLQTGNLDGTVLDPEGQPIPGATLTVTGLGDPRVGVTDEEGQFRFPGLAPGTYQAKVEANGFSTFEYTNVTVTVGRNTQVEVTLSAAAVEEGVAVIPDEQRISTGQTVSQTELEKVPTARDPWAILQTTPGVLTDRINVGGNEADQQSQYVSPGQPADPRFTGTPMEALAKVLSGNDLFEPGTAQGVSASKSTYTPTRTRPPEKTSRS
ncbi:MAG: carboxypeptidase-like regulatory domain-containing protein [Gemmatimonadota bacterium]